MGQITRPPSVEAVVGNLDQRLANLERLQTLDTGWITPTMENSWVNTEGLRYRRIGGRVYLKGVTKGGANGTQAFVLPVGYRPEENTQLIV